MLTNEKMIALKLFQKLVAENDIFIIGEHHAEISPAFNLLMDYLFYNNKDPDKFRFENNKYCLFVEGLPSFYSKPNHVPTIVSGHQKFSWFFYYLGLNIRGIERDSLHEKKITDVRNAQINKNFFQPFQGERFFENDFEKRGHYLDRIMQNKTFSMNVNSSVEENKFDKIFIVCGSAHANDLSLGVDKYGIEKIYPGIKINNNSKKVVRILVDNSDIKRSKFDFSDDSAIGKKVKQDVELTIPVEFGNTYNYYFDYFINYYDTKKNLIFYAINKIFNSYDFLFSCLHLIIENPEKIKTSYEIEKSRKEVLLNLPLLFEKNTGFYSVTYKYKIAKIIKVAEYFFAANYLKDWNPVIDLNLVNKNKVNYPVNENLTMQEKKRKNFSLGRIFSKKKKMT